MATKRELLDQIQKHEASIPRLKSMLEDIPIEIEQLKATIKLKKKAIAEIEEKEG